MLRSSLKLKTPLRFPNGERIRRRPCSVRTRAYTAKKWDDKAYGRADVQTVKKVYAKDGYHVAAATVAGKFDTGLHSHDVEVIMVAIAGLYEVEVDGKTINMGPGDIVSTPKDVEHREIIPEGKTTTLVFATTDKRITDAVEQSNPEEE